MHGKKKDPCFWGFSSAVPSGNTRTFSVVNEDTESSPQVVQDSSCTAGLPCLLVRRMAPPTHPG